MFFFWLSVDGYVFAENSDCKLHHCIAIVDAGSTGSRLHIYAYDLNQLKQPIGINEIWSKKIKPGFATLEPQQASIQSYLDQLFSNAPEANIPVYFYATAGMRLQPIPRQQSLYQILNLWFQQHPEWLLKESKTITGNDEGVYGWLAVNYQLGGFDSPDKPLAAVMDMGGASVQVTFPVDPSFTTDGHMIEELDVGGRHLALFVRSFLGLGQTVLSQQFLEDENCFAIGYLLPNGLEANGDSQACQHDVTKLINNVHRVDQIVIPAMTRSLTTSWYVIGGAASLADDPLFSFPNGQFTNQQLLLMADTKACHQQWQVLYGQYPKNEYLYGSCLFPSYYYALMVDGYGIKPNESIHYLPSGQGADWTLGVVLHQH